MKELASIFAILLSVGFAKAQTDTVYYERSDELSRDTVSRSYEFEFGSMPNNESGAISTYNASRLIFDQTNRLIKAKLNTKLGRASNAFLVQFFLGKELYGVFPHEFFGHYTRGLEFGMDMKKVHLRFPGIGGYTTANITHQVPVNDRMMWAAAGSEVQSGIAFLAEKDLYTGGFVSSYQANPILFNKVFMYLYYREDLQSFTKDPDKFIENKLAGGDFSSYAFTLAESYGYYDNIIHKDAEWFNFPSDPNILNIDFVKDQNKRLHNAYLLSLFDFGMIEFLIGNYQYIVKGKEFYKPFMFKINNLKFMPSIRANMGEIGAENYFDLVFAHPKVPQFNTYYRKGGNSIDNLNGFGFGMRNIKISDKLLISPQVDFWHLDRGNKSGMNIYSDFKVFLSDKFYLFQSLGYKSTGGLMGKPAKEGLYGYIGFGIKTHL